MTGGIGTRNFRRNGFHQRAYEYGAEFLVPPNDEQFVVARYPIMDTTANGNFPLAAPLQRLGGKLPWPCRIVMVAANRGAPGEQKSPNLVQANPSFAGNDQVNITITGKLNGKVVTETFQLIGAASLDADNGVQREWKWSTNFYDEITSISHTHVNGAYGTTTPLLLSFGLGLAHHGDWMDRTQRLNIMAPGDLPDSSYLSGAMMIADMAEAVLPEWMPFLSYTVQLGANTLTRNTHGLPNGTEVRLRAQNPLGVLPGGVDQNTTYYVVGTAANTMQLAATIGGAAIDLVALGGFTDGDTLAVLTRQNRPISWVQGNPTQSQGEFTVDLTANTLGKTAHGLPNGTPVRLTTAGNGIPGGASSTTTYFVVAAAANTIQIASVPGGAAIDLSTTGTFADLETVNVNKIEDRVNVQQHDKLILVPGVPAPFSTLLGRGTVTVATETVTLADHGLVEGDAVRFQSDGDGLPAGILSNVTYFVIGPTASTFLVAPSPLGFSFASDAGTDTLTKTGHGLVDGTPVRLFNLTSAIPTGLSANTTYYVVSAAANTIQLSLTSGGAAIDITGAQTPVGVIPLINMTASGDLADTEEISVWRPTHVWRPARMLFVDGLTLG